MNLPTDPAQKAFLEETLLRLKSDSIKLAQLIAENPSQNQNSYVVTDEQLFYTVGIVKQKPVVTFNAICPAAFEQSRAEQIVGSFNFRNGNGPVQTMAISQADFFQRKKNVIDQTIGMFEPGWNG